jgi:hypothetical protein
MTLSDLASIGSLISGVAVLVSLVYLNLQTRQAAKNQQSLMQHGRSEQLGNWLQYISQPDMAQLMIDGNEGHLDTTDFCRYNSAVWAMVIRYENNFVQHRSGMLDDVQYEATLGSLKFQCGLPGFRANWKLIRPTMDAHFVTFVDELISATPVVSGTAERSHATWKAIVAQEAAKTTS